MAKTKNRRVKAADAACESANKKGTVTIVLLVVLIATIVVVPIMIVVYVINAIGGMIPAFPDLSGLIP